MAKGSIKARVQCTIEIPVGTWSGGGTTDLDQLTEQVRKEGADKIIKLVALEHGRIIGSPRVMFVVLEEER